MDDDLLGNLHNVKSVNSALFRFASHVNVRGFKGPLSDLTFDTLPKKLPSAMRCLHCDGPFTGKNHKVWPLILDQNDNGTLVIDTVFFNTIGCLRRHVMEMNEPRRSRLLSLMEQQVRGRLGIKGPLPVAPERRCLIRYGGPLSYKQFHEKTHCDVDNVRFATHGCKEFHTAWSVVEEFDIGKEQEDESHKELKQVLVRSLTNGQKTEEYVELPPPCNPEDHIRNPVTKLRVKRTRTTKKK